MVMKINNHAYYLVIWMADILYMISGVL